MTRRAKPAPCPDDVEDQEARDVQQHEVDDVEQHDEGAEVEEDGPVPIACQWGTPGWCATGRHHRCYFTTDAETIKAGTYGHHDGHVWICPCPCHTNQGYPPCPHPSHHGQEGDSDRWAPSDRPVQIHLF